MQLDHDQEKDAFIRFYDVQRKECVLTSITGSEHKFELEEETFDRDMDLADVGFVKIERELAKNNIYPLKEDEVEPWHEMDGEHDIGEHGEDILHLMRHPDSDYLQ